MRTILVPPTPLSLTLRRWRIDPINPPQIPRGLGNMELPLQLRSIDDERLKSL